MSVSLQQTVLSSFFSLPAYAVRQKIEEIEKAGIRLMQADNNRLDGFSHEVPHQGLIALAAPIDIGMSFDTLMDNLAGNPLLLL